MSPFIHFTRQTGHPWIRLTNRTRWSHFFQSSTLTHQRFGGDIRFQMMRTRRRWGLLSGWGRFQGYIPQFLGRKGNGYTRRSLSFFPRRRRLASPRGIGRGRGKKTTTTSSRGDVGGRWCYSIGLHGSHHASHPFTQRGG